MRIGKRSPCCDDPILPTPRPKVLTVIRSPVFHYSAFGLTLQSDLEMPELRASLPTNADVVVARGRVTDAHTRPDEPVQFQFREQSGLRHDTLAWSGVAAFEVRGADRIIYAPDNAASDALVSLPLLGPVMSVLLHRRGLLTLHGSAVDVGGAATVFLGDKGAGKSTTAAAMVRAGHDLLTDDIVAIDAVPSNRLQVLPAYPQLKLTDSAHAGLVLSGVEEMPSPHPDFGKHRLLLNSRFEGLARPLGEAVVLERGPRLELSPLNGMQAVGALLRFSYVTRFGDRIIRDQAQAVHLRQCAAVANQVKIYRLTVPDDLQGLGQVPRLILDDRAARLTERAG